MTATRNRPETPRAGSSRGAVTARTRLGDRLGSWWDHHRHSAGDSLKRLLAQPVQSLMTWLVLAIAIALPAALFLLVGNLQQATGGWDGGAQLTAFLHPRAREAAIAAVADDLRAQPTVASLELLSPEQALAEFQQFSGYGDALSGLGDNPLPPVLVLTLSPGIAPEQAEALLGELQADPRIDSAVLDLAWVRRLQSLLAIGQRLVLALAALLGVGVLLAVGNTIRLAIENRRDEILVVKLVGATDAFVRRPFLYTGLWYGLGGGLLALLLLGLAQLWLQQPVARLAGLYHSDFSLHGLGFAASIALLAGSAVLGLLGAWLAVGRHLGAIQPK